MIKSLTPIRWLTLQWKGDRNGNNDEDVLAALTLLWFLIVNGLLEINYSAATFNLCKIACH